MEENRVALISIVVEKNAAIEKVNAVLHEYGASIIGRMGLPYRERGISLISVAIDAPAGVISALSGKLGMVEGVSSKAVYAKLSKDAGGEA